MRGSCIWPMVLPLASGMLPRYLETDSMSNVLEFKYCGLETPEAPRSPNSLAPRGKTHQSSLFQVPEVAPACRATSGSPVATSLGPIRTTGPYFLNKSRCMYACLLLPAVIAIQMSATCQNFVSNQSVHIMCTSEPIMSSCACLVAEDPTHFTSRNGWHRSWEMLRDVWILTRERG